MTVTNIHSVSIIQVSTIASSDPPLQTPWTALFVGPITRNSNIIYIYVYIYFQVAMFLKTGVYIYLTIILRGRAGYEMVDNQRGA